MAVKVRTVWALLLAADEANRKAAEALGSWLEEDSYMVMEAIHDMTGEMRERLMKELATNAAGNGQ